MVRRRLSGMRMMGVDFYPSERYAAIVVAIARREGVTVRSFRNVEQGYTVILVPVKSYDADFDVIRKAEESIPAETANIIEGVSQDAVRHVIRGYVGA
jgi:hypothetical protein